MTHVPNRRRPRNERASDDLAPRGAAEPGAGPAEAALEASAGGHDEAGEAGKARAEVVQVSGVAVVSTAFAGTEYVEGAGAAESDNAIDRIEPSEPDSADYVEKPADRYYTPPRPARFGRPRSRRNYIGGSDARIIMGGDEEAVIRLWKEKRGEVEPQDLHDNLVVQLGVVTETLNRIWYVKNTGLRISKVQAWIRHPVVRWMGATLDGFVDDIDAVFEAKFMLPWSFSEDAALAKHMAQLQHNMWVTNARSAVLSIITGGGKWIEMTIPADPLYQHFLITAERRFWRCVKTGETPRPYGLEPPTPPVKATRIVDMDDSNAWAEFAGLYAATRPAFLDHERAKAELKALMPEDAREASGHGLRARRAKNGAVSFDILSGEDAHATLQ